MPSPTAAAAVPVRGWSFATDASMAADAAAVAASECGDGGAGSSRHAACAPFHQCRVADDAAIYQGEPR